MGIRQLVTAVTLHELSRTKNIYHREEVLLTHFLALFLLCWHFFTGDLM